MGPTDGGPQCRLARDGNWRGVCDGGMGTASAETPGESRESIPQRSARFAVRPGIDDQAGPLARPAGGLVLVDLPRREQWVEKHPLSEEVAVAVRSVAVDPSGRVTSEGVATGGGREVVDRVPAAAERRSGNTEVFLLPQVYPRLVALCQAAAG